MTWMFCHVFPGRCNTCKTTENQHQLVQCDTCHYHYHLACVDPPLTRMPKRSAKCLWWVEKYPPSLILFFDRWRPGRVEIATHGVVAKAKWGERGDGGEKIIYRPPFPLNRSSAPLFCNSIRQFQHGNCAKINTCAPAKTPAIQRLLFIFHTDIWQRTKVKTSFF